MIFVIDSDRVMAECIAKATCREAMIFANAIEAMNEIAKGVIPAMIFMDVMLDGPDGFTFLNELVSYDDTAEIPVVIVTSLDLKARGLRTYGVVGVLNKETMRPRDIAGYVDKYTRSHGGRIDEYAKSHVAEAVIARGNYRECANESA